MNMVNPYFLASDVETVSSLETLLSLNVAKKFSRPGDTTPVTDWEDFSISPHTTAGIFRGQLDDSLLIPTCFRDLPIPDKPLSEVDFIWRWVKATRDFESFCERAALQNAGFPEKVSDRMSIAQHFGVSTPLLDWSRNILTAIFFAIKDVYRDSDFENKLRVFIYHIEDEWMLAKGLPSEDQLRSFSKSAFVDPPRIDRRIERQQGVFTFHPDPARCPEKIPVRIYLINLDLILMLIKLMKGFGFTDDYFFPDYAGIAASLKSDSSLT